MTYFRAIQCTSISIVYICFLHLNAESNTLIAIDRKRWIKVQCHYFTGSKHGLDNLKKRRLKVSNLNNLNDPFEMLCVATEDKRVKSLLVSAKNEIAKNFGILCFSGNWTNPVQWGHYAENHCGLCLVFDIPEWSLKPINYVSTRLRSQDIDLSSEEAAFTLMTTKFQHWHYEEEYRSIMWLNSLEQENGLHFKPFDMDLKLKKVIIGAYSRVKKANIEKLVSRDVEVIHAKLHDTEFKVTRDRTK